MNAFKKHKYFWVSVLFYGIMLLPFIAAPHIFLNGILLFSPLGVLFHLSCVAAAVITLITYSQMSAEKDAQKKFTHMVRGHAIALLLVGVTALMLLAWLGGGGPLTQ